jgi:hypothetical protein
MNSNLQVGVLILAFSAKTRATASQITTLNSSSFLGNFAITRLPSRSSTDAFGRVLLKMIQELSIVLNLQHFHCLELSVLLLITTLEDIQLEE